MDELLAQAPTFERSLVELRASWREVPEACERVAAKLRVFVLNWDPLGWQRDAFEPDATATGDGDTFELVLYVPHSDAVADRDLLGELARSVVTVGVEQELLLSAGSYAQLAHAGKVPGLLSAAGTLPAIDPPTFVAAGSGWEPIGLGAIQDLVQASFGPVDLDRAKVVLDPAPDLVTGCPACAGRRFGFPAELADAQAAMCARHAEEAGEIIAARLSRAEASNPDGWRAIADASAALSEPTFGLPLALLDRLDDAVERRSEDVAPDVLRADAAAALELASTCVAARMISRVGSTPSWRTTG